MNQIFLDIDHERDDNHNGPGRFLSQMTLLACSFLVPAE